MQAHSTATPQAPSPGASQPSASEIVAPALQSLVTGLVSVRAQIHALHALEATMLAMGDSLATQVAERDGHADHGEVEHRALAAEFATAVHESDRTMTARIGRAVTLVQDYPAVHHALQHGQISQSHAALITDAGHIISDEGARTQYAVAALNVARSETTGRLRGIVKELAERFSTRTIDERHEAARTGRMVRVVELGDGMADLTATLPAVYAYGITDRLNQMAWAVKHHEHATTRKTPHSDGTGEPGVSGSSDTSTGETPVRVVRTVDQIRADLLTDMLLASDPNHTAASGHTGLTGIHARIQVIIPKKHVDTDTNENDAGANPSRSTDADADADESADSGAGATASPATTPPATLDGYGPIDTNTAQILAGNTSHWEQVTINPSTGAVISVDTYRPNTKLRQFLRARDLHCRFPGCHTPTNRCDIDHTIDAALGGPTTNTNLAHLCRRHHTLKHHSQWTVHQQHDGTLTWTSPLNTKYTERPPSTVRFRPVPESHEKPPKLRTPSERTKRAEPMPF